MHLLRIDHETKLSYSSPVYESVIEIRTSPLALDDQAVLGYKLRVSPPAPVTSYRDGFGNKVEMFNILAPCREVIVRASSCVRVLRVSAAKALDDVAWDPTLAEHLEAIEFLRPSPLANAAKGVKAFAQTVSFREVKTMKDAAETVMAAVRAKLTYEKKVTGAYTPVSESLALGRGVCQDFAHLFIAVARLCGLAARYVSGYVNQPGELATHAWVQVWGGPDVGWANLDPTHNCWCAADYVVTAVGRDFGDVPPNRGVWKGDADETITVSVNVQPVDRVPNDLSEPIDAPAWSSAAFAAATAGREKWLSQQNRARVFRQQQSQQQQ